MKKTLIISLCCIFIALLGLLAYLFVGLNQSDEKKESQEEITSYPAIPLTAFSKSEVLNSQNIKIIPAIVSGKKVFIQAFDNITSEMSFFLLGNDSKTYELKLLDKNIARYDNVNWGYEDNYAIQLIGTSPVFPEGYLVAIGKDPKDILKWFPAVTLGKTPSDKNVSYWDSDKDISKDDTYELKEQAFFKVPNIGGKLFFAGYKKSKIDNESCDPKSYKNTIGLMTAEGQKIIILDTFYNCDGLPRDDNNYFPLGDVLGTLEISHESKKEIWIVMKAHGYEIVGIAFVKCLPEESFNKNKYDFLCTGSL